MEDALQGIAKDVATYGWSVMRVFADADGPEFAYSIGLTRTFEHPEIIIVGLPADRAHQLINDAGAAIRAGRRFAAGEVSSDFLEGYDVTFRRVPSYQYQAYLEWGVRFYGDTSFAVLQMVYPDRERRWPWQPGVISSFRANQPVLADEPEPPWAHDRAV